MTLITLSKRLTNSKIKFPDMKINIQTLKEALALIVLLSILGTCIFSLIELWTLSDFAYRMKWSFVTVLFTAMVAGLYIESIKPPEK
jgi:glucan phosphoethanolaminetransferase (alkaline phosphatase superfamily)